jgi:prepilin-type processing-associated H-X9-DG protein
MKQIGLALMTYANSNRGAYPPDLATLLSNSPALATEVMTCPSSPDTPAAGAATLNAGGHLSYVYMPGLNVSSPADAVLLYEPLTNHSSDGTNVLFADGHVEFLLTSQAQPLITAVQAGRNPPRATAPPGGPTRRKPGQFTPSPPTSADPER